MSDDSSIKMFTGRTLSISNWRCSETLSVIKEPRVPSVASTEQ